MCLARPVTVTRRKNIVRILFGAITYINSVCIINKIQVHFLLKVRVFPVYKIFSIYSLQEIVQESRAV